MRDGTNTVMVKRGISPAVIANNTARVSQIVDRLGYEWLIADIVTGTLVDADATFTVLVEDGNDSGLSDAAAVVDAELVSQTVGTAPEAAASFTFAADNNVRKIEYIGLKRYVRLTITPATNTGNALFGMVWRLGSPQQATVTQGPS